MTACEIFIENKKLDISSDISNLITYAIDDVKDFSSRNTTFSKTIILPGTANNNLLFGNIFKVEVNNAYDSAVDNVSTNFNAAVSADCLIFQNHLQVFKGTLRLMEIVITNGIPEYEVAVFGDLGGLVGALGSAKLEDLDFSAYDHTFAVSGITASWDTINGTGVYYPLMDVGTVSSAKINYSYRAFRPSLYVYEYLDKIFAASGYRYESDFFNTTRFKSLIIPYNQKELRYATYAQVTALRTTEELVMIETGAGNASFQTFTGTAWTANVGKTEFTYTGLNTVEVGMYFLIPGRATLQYNPALLTIRKNGTAIPGYSKSLPVTGASQNYRWEHAFVLTVSTGDVIDFYYESAVSLPTNRVWAGDSNGCIFSVYALVPSYLPATPGAPITMNDCIPRNVLQKDFLASIIKLFNLYVYEDKNASKKLYIEPYVDYYDLNVSGVVDWNYKIDRSKAIRLRPMSELNSRYYNFRFKDDTDYYNDLYKKSYGETFGNNIYDSDFEFANDKSDVDVIFSPTPLVGYTGVDKIVSAIYKKNSGVEETTDFNIRILQAKKITGVASWDIKNALVTLSTQTVYGYAGNYDDPDAPANDIHFGAPKELYFTLISGAINVTQFNVYWSSYMAEITDKNSKLYTAMAKLTASDINGIDFSKLVYVDGCFWRLNKIEDWNASIPDVCKVELLKVINLLY